MKFRIYALILGEILPEGEIYSSKIGKMELKEQKRRGFRPIQNRLHPTTSLGHKTYVTSLTYIDPIRMKSEYVVSCDIDEVDPQSAIGGAIRHLDRLCRMLSFSYLEDCQQHSRRNNFPFQPYIYQVNKLYRINDDGSEVSVSPKVKNDGYYLPDRPSLNKWRHGDTPALLQDLVDVHDDILERALKYLYRSSIGQYMLDSPEKVVLDHIKAVEIIVGALSSKEKFAQRLEEAKTKLGLTDEEE